MSGSVPVTFIVTVSVRQDESGSFSPNVAVVQQQGRSYKTSSMDLEEELFRTQAAAVDHAVVSAKATLKKSSPNAEIKFNLPTSGKESELSALTSIYRYGTRLYGKHPRLGDMALSFMRRPTGELVHGGLCALPEKARLIKPQELSVQDEITILEVLKSLGKEQSNDEET